MKLAALFSDHMVVQRDIPIPVWGWADAGAAIAVEMAGNTAAAVAGADGKWRATLPALPAGGPYTLTVRGTTTLTVNDVMVGEVWICSGQSNMQFTVSVANDAEVEIAAAEYPGIRLFSVPRVAAITPQDDVDSAWQVCSPDSAGNFSAVGYYFGRELHQRLGVAVGLIDSSWGGTVAEAWTSREGLLAEPSLADMVTYFEKNLENQEQMQAEHRVRLAAWEKIYLKADPGNSGFARGWADPATSTADWAVIPAPGSWQSHGLDFSGVLWFRKEVDVPAAWAGQTLTLRLGACDKNDVTYFNNVQVGALSMEDCPDSWNVPRVYTVPGELVKPGKNLIAVRIYSHWYAGGFMGQAPQMRLEMADGNATPLPLAGEWQYAVEHNFGRVVVAGMPTPPLGAGNQNAPYALYSGMIAPLAPYGIRGAIWYQGESNATRPVQYRTLFPAMISDWRRVWGQDDFAFYFVQLANYMARGPQPAESNWAALREAQSMTLALPQTGMAVIIDIGDASDIHPRNKQDVGLRLAVNALTNTYVLPDITPSGPQYASAEVEGNKIRLRFDYVDGGLVAKGGALTSFAIAGADRNFVWGDAVIDGDTVLVSSPSVPNPVAVRYGWADNPACNLYNAAGIPASPFRTDTWPVGEEVKLAEAAR